MKKKIYFSCNPYFPDSFQFKKVTWWRNIIIWICDLDIDWEFVWCNVISLSALYLSTYSFVTILLRAVLK